MEGPGLPGIGSHSRLKRKTPPHMAMKGQRAAQGWFLLKPHVVCMMFDRCMPLGQEATMLTWGKQVILVNLLSALLAILVSRVQ